MTVKDELLALQEKSADGMLHADVVVAWAERHKSSELHKQFEWDDTAAAREYRLYQARRVIQLNVVTGDRKPILVSLSVDRVQGGGYRRVDDVAASRDLSHVLLMDALSELERVQAKYEWITELTSVWEQVKATRARHPRPEKEKRKAVTA